MKKGIVLFVILALILDLCACVASQLDAPDAETSQGPIWQEQYDLGVRYLSEGNYQEAIIAFTAAIEIDPKQALAYVGRGDAYVLSGETEENLAAAKTDYEHAIELDGTNAEAYLGLADVYIRQGDYEKALEVLRKAVEKAAENQSVVDKIAEIEAAHISEMVEAGDYSFLFTDDFMKPQDWIVNGKPINECELADFQAEFPHADSAFPSVHFKDDDGWTYVPDWPTMRDHANVVVNDDGKYGTDIFLYGEAQDADFYFQPNLRGITTNDSYFEILQKIGFSPAGIDFLATTTDDIKYTASEHDETLWQMSLIHWDGPLSDRTLSITYHEWSSSEVWYTTEYWFRFTGDSLYDIYCSVLTQVW